MSPRRGCGGFRTPDSADVSRSHRFRRQRIAHDRQHRHRPSSRRRARRRRSAEKCRPCHVSGEGRAGNHFCFYAADMQARARNEALLDGELRHALESKRIPPLLPAAGRSRSGDIVARSAFALEPSRRGRRGPGVFLRACRGERPDRAASTNGCCAKPVARRKGWQRMGLPPACVGVNLSPVAVPQAPRRCLSRRRWRKAASIPRGSISN